MDFRRYAMRRLGYFVISFCIMVPVSALIIFLIDGLLPGGEGREIDGILVMATGQSAVMTTFLFFMRDKLNKH